MPDLSTYVGIVATAWDGSFGRDAVRLHEGRDHDVVLVGTAAAFRFPRHDFARDALPREVAALASLPDPDVVLPRVILDCSDAPLGRAFVGQRFLAGEPLPRASVDAVGPLAYRFAAEIARVLDALAAVPVDGLAVGTGDDHDAIRDALYGLMSAGGRARADDELAAVPPPAVRALVHGDFTGANLLWDADDTRLTGVLDWAHVHAGDPAYDVASLATTYGWDLAATVAAATARDDDDLLERARAHAATFDLWTAYGAFAAGDRTTAERALERYL